MSYARSVPASKNFLRFVKKYRDASTPPTVFILAHKFCSLTNSIHCKYLQFHCLTNALLAISSSFIQGSPDTVLKMNQTLSLEEWITPELSANLFTFLVIANLGIVRENPRSPHRFNLVIMKFEQPF